MRVLMLGWEFPPHISGGLGTACHGLTGGLARHGIEVCFVVPRAHGDEDQSCARVLGCNDVEMPAQGRLLEHLPARAPLTAAAGQGTEPVPVSDPISAPLGASVSSGSAAAQDPAERPLPPPAAGRGPARNAIGNDPLLETLAIASPLRPYMTEAAYRAAVAAAPAPAGGRAPDPVARAATRRLAAELSRAPSPEAPTPGAAESSLPAPPAAEELVERCVRTARKLDFTGFYGDDLMGEVARYALVVAQLARPTSEGGAGLAFDVIHAHDWMTYPAGLAAARISGRPLVAHVHACEYDRSGEDVNPEVRELERLGLAGADRVICVSHYTEGVVRRRYGIDPGKLRVVHNAVTQKEQSEAWRATKRIPEPIVLFLGRVTFQKGPDYFLEAAARVVRVRPRVKFVMSGSGDMLPRMVERAARLGLARHVHFTGFLKGAEVERMYAMADLYVMPSVSEPFGISPLEAMALDVPVIVSRQSGVCEVLRNALKVDFWDVQEIANKILALLAYPALASTLANEGRGEVRAMRWEARARKVRDVYEELVA